MTYSCKPQCHVFVSQPRLGERLEGFTGKRLIHFGASYVPSVPITITSLALSSVMAGNEIKTIIIITERFIYF